MCLSIGFHTFWTSAHVNHKVSDCSNDNNNKSTAAVRVARSDRNRARRHSDQKNFDSPNRKLKDDLETTCVFTTHIANFQ